MARTSLNQFFKNIVSFSGEPISCELDGEQVVIQFHGQTYVTTKEDVLQLAEIFREVAQGSKDRGVADELFVKAAKLELALEGGRPPTRH
jgi:hypothetical protein